MKRSSTEIISSPSGDQHRGEGFHAVKRSNMEGTTPIIESFRDAPATTTVAAMEVDDVNENKQENDGSGTKNAATAMDTTPTDTNGPTAASPPQRASLLTLMSRPTSLGNETGELAIGEFEPTSNARVALEQFRVLVVGAGGLGCELLKDLALSGIVHVDVIDLDSIDVTNLNRQFLFRSKDVGQSKSEVAARFINQHCPWMKVTPHFGKIQDKDPSFYAQFNCIISGLDNIEARRWLNATLCSLVQIDEDGDPDPTTIIPLIDGGTEGWAGQARVILPRITSCFECSLDSFPPQTKFPLCTIAETPRRPEHCIAYASILQWPKVFPNEKLDTDSPKHMTWVYEQARERAQKYQIEGVTYMMTLGVVKNIIPAVASTNAIIAAICVNEAIKLLTFCSKSLNTYMMYMGSEGVYSHTFVYERKDECPVCQSSTLNVTFSKTKTLNELRQSLLDGDLRLSKPSLTAPDKVLYMPHPPSLEKATRPNLDKTLLVLLADGNADTANKTFEITVTDPILQHSNLALSVTLE